MKGPPKSDFPVFDPTVLNDEDRQGMKDILETFKEKLLGMTPAAGSSSAGITLDLKSVSVILFVTALCAGKEPEDVEPTVMARTAFLWLICCLSLMVI